MSARRQDPPTHHRSLHLYYNRGLHCLLENYTGRCTGTSGTVTFDTGYVRTRMIT